MKNVTTIKDVEKKKETGKKMDSWENNQNNNQSNIQNNGQNQNAYGQNQNAYGQNMYGQPQNNYAYGQQFPNYNQIPYPGPGYTPREMEEPVEMGEWAGLLALGTFVPCIGIILMIVWAFGNTEKKSKSNFCKAFLIIWLIKVALLTLVIIIWGASLASVISEF